MEHVGHLALFDFTLIYELNYFLILFWITNKIQNIEGQYALKFNNLKALSVEQVVDCDGTTDNTTIQSDCGVYGGCPYLAFQYIQNAVSINLSWCFVII